MTAKEMLYEFELTVDRISSKGAMNLPLPAKVAYLNRGQLSLVLSKYGGNTKDQTGFEETEKRIQELQILHVTNEKLLVSRLNKEIYAADLKATKKKLMLITRKQIFASKGNCKEQAMKVIHDAQTDDLNEELNNPNSKPDFRWREVLTRVAENKLQIFTDSSFSIDWVILDYLRYPKRIDIEGYEHFDGSLSSDQESELPELMHYEIVNKAAVEWDFDIKNPGAQSTALKLQMQE